MAATKVISIEEGYRILARTEWYRMLPYELEGDEAHALLNVQGIEPIFVPDEIYEELYWEHEESDSR
jgi:hypothetical protein